MSVSLALPWTYLALDLSGLGLALGVVLVADGSILDVPWLLLHPWLLLWPFACLHWTDLLALDRPGIWRGIADESLPLETDPFAA